MFLTHQKIETYLESYCDKFELKQHINFGRKVVSAEQVNGKWELKTEGKEGSETWQFDKLIVAHGHDQSPSWPKVEDLDKFEGTMLHVGK